MKNEIKRRRSVLMSIAVLAVVMLAAIGMTGCGTAQEAVPEETTVAASEEAPAVLEETQVPAVLEETQAVEKDVIGEEKALEIALEDAGFAESDVSYSNCHLDYDDGRTEYEIEFHQGEMEYEYTVDAFTGDILEKDQDLIND